MSNAAPDYSALVAEAQKAVAAVKDPDLRRAAFDKVLERLLDGPTAPPPGPSATQSRKARSPSKTRNAATRRGPQAYVQELVDENFFKKQQSIAAVKTELANRGHHIALTSLSGPLQTLCQRKQLRRTKAAAGKGQKASFVYSNW